MIHEIAQEVAVRLAAASCPIPVVDGPEATASALGTRERIVFAPGDADDSFGPPNKSNQSPGQRMIRRCPVRVTIYARSPSAGALPWEHRNRADLILDKVLVALDYVLNVRGHSSTWPLIRGGRFVPIADTEKSERPACAVYELDFVHERAIDSTPWDGTEPTEFALASGTIASVTRVSVDGDDTPEQRTACGA